MDRTAAWATAQLGDLASARTAMARAYSLACETGSRLEEATTLDALGALDGVDTPNLVAAELGIVAFARPPPVAHHVVAAEHPSA